MPQEGAKKLVLVSTTSTSVTKDNEEVFLVSVKELKQLTCIQYLIAFSGGITQNGSALDPVSAFLDSGSEVNTMHPAFAERLGLVVQATNVGAQKIDGTTLETYGMIVAVFSVTDQANRVKFFEETFLVANVSQNVDLGMPFFTLSGADIDFTKKELQ